MISRIRQCWSGLITICRKTDAQMTSELTYCFYLIYGTNAGNGSKQVQWLCYPKTSQHFQQIKIVTQVQYKILENLNCGIHVGDKRVRLLCYFFVLTSFLSHSGSIAEQKYSNIKTVRKKKHTFDIYLRSSCFSSQNNQKTRYRNGSNQVQ